MSALRAVRRVATSGAALYVRISSAMDMAQAASMLDLAASASQALANEASPRVTALSWYPRSASSFRIFVSFSVALFGIDSVSVSVVSSQ